MNLSRLLLGAACAGLAGCAAVAPGTTGGTAAPAPTQIESPADAWRIRTAEHVDLWLHGYAMLSQDTSYVPLFDRDYRARMTQVRRQRNVTTALDANLGTLSARFAANPGIVNGHFAIFHYQSFEELQRAVDLFIRSEGSPGAVGDPAQRQLIAPLAAYFRSVADREWLRLYVQALADEHARFYRDYWQSQQQARNRVLFAVDRMWNDTYRAKFQRYLTNSRQPYGSMLLSLPLGGEGRTIQEGGGSAVAITFPDSEARAVEAIYVFAHEISAAVVSVAVDDHTTPAQRQSGEVDRIVPRAAVRGGALLLQRIAPELVPGYMRYYLSIANRPAPSGDASAEFAAAFTIPNAVRDGIARQIEAILGGI